MAACLLTCFISAAVFAYGLERHWPADDLAPVIVVGVAAYVGLFFIIEAHLDALHYGHRRTRPRAADLETELDELRRSLSSE
jgi:hypothetical protein